jgi:hypothetical protein
MPKYSGYIEAARGGLGRLMGETGLVPPNVIGNSPQTIASYEIVISNSVAILSLLAGFPPQLLPVGNELDRP